MRDVNKASVPTPEEKAAGPTILVEQKPFWSLLTPGSKVRLVVSSDPRGPKEWAKTLEFRSWLESLGLVVALGQSLREPEAYSPEARANDINEAFADPDASMIFDVSGGTLANGTMEYFDFAAAAASGKPYFGFSNVSVVLNTLLSRACLPVGLYDPMRTVYERSGHQKQLFQQAFLAGSARSVGSSSSASSDSSDSSANSDGSDSSAKALGRTLFSFTVTKCQGQAVSGKLAGGNIRSLLQLAGTPYWPDFSDKILILESLGGDEKRADSQFWQLRQMGVFDQIKGIILGQFTEAKAERGLPSVLSAVVADPAFPIWVTAEVGHSLDSQGMILGQAISLP